MRGLARLILTAAAIVMILGCQSGADTEETSTTDEVIMNDWSIQVETSGGIAGRGQGAIAIRSDGTVELTTMTGELCHQTIGGEVLSKLDDAVTHARPGAWDDEYPFDRGADMFHYTLTLSFAEDQETTVGWKDGSEIPADLAELWDAIRSVWTTVDCAPTV